MVCISRELTPETWPIQLIVLIRHRPSNRALRPRLPKAHRAMVEIKLKASAIMIVMARSKCLPIKASVFFSVAMRGDGARL